MKQIQINRQLRKYNRGWIMNHQMFELILNLTARTKKSVKVNKMELRDAQLNLVPHFIQNGITFDWN